MATLPQTVPMNRGAMGVWIGASFGLISIAVGYVWMSPTFAVGRPARDLPILLFAIGFLLVSWGALGLFALVRQTPQSGCRGAVAVVFGAGIVARLVLIGATPVLEVDFNRYLWDGGMTFHGYNPYSVAPAGIAQLSYGDPRLELSKAAGVVFDGISYRTLKTIYPPVAQAFFALAHGISAWSLTAWRLVAVASEVVTFVLILALLRQVGRSRLWVAVYWWNPLVLKETVDSAHMDVLTTPFVLGAVLATIRQRHALAVGSLGLAIGTKIWPLVLAPLILRPLLRRPMAFVGAVAALACMVVACAMPVIMGGLDQTSGFVSYATHWATNSALFPGLEATVRAGAGWMDPADARAGQAVRILGASFVVVLALVLALSPLRGPQDIVSRAYWTVTALLLVSPTQFPWYLLWVLPLAVVERRVMAWFVAAALMPLYYSAFHFYVRGDGALYAQFGVWLIWLPVWSVMVRDVWIARLPRPSRALPPVKLSA